jgi:hypothetical protein
LVSYPEGRTQIVFENRLLVITLRSKRKDVAAGWRILYNEELHDLKTSNIIRAILFITFL